jgi:hypothetical protein
MKNTEYVVHIITKHGRTWSYLKEGNGWTQTALTGRVRGLDAEQLLSHLLPPLAGDKLASGWNHATDAGQMIVVRPNVLNNMFRFCSIENLMFLTDV